MKSLLVALGLVLNSSSFGWDATGHMVIAQIALTHCQPATAAKARAMLAGATWTQGTKVHDYTNPVIGARFADDIVDSVYGHNPYETFNYKTWHYADREEGGPPIDLGATVVEGIVDAEAKLAGLPTDSYSGGKAEALLFLLHFVGDAHQPLHCWDHNDRGGHYTLTLPSGKTIACHVLWDDTAKDAFGLKGNAQPPIVQAAAALVAQYAPSISVAEKTDLSPRDWANESYDYASKSIFAIGDHPTQEQIDKWSDDGLRRMTLAGLRLARVLDRYVGRLN